MLSPLYQPKTINLEKIINLNIDVFVDMLTYSNNEQGSKKYKKSTQYF